MEVDSFSFALPHPFLIRIITKLTKSLCVDFVRSCDTIMPSVLDACFPDQYSSLFLNEEEIE